MLLNDCKTKIIVKGEKKIINNLFKNLSEKYKSTIKIIIENDLTKQEKRVLSLVTEGFNNIEISEKLYISRSTVKSHVCSILNKLEVHDRLQAAVKSVKEGIL